MYVPGRRIKFRIWLMFQFQSFICNFVARAEYERAATGSPGASEAQLSVHVARCAPGSRENFTNVRARSLCAYRTLSSSGSLPNVAPIARLKARRIYANVRLPCGENQRQRAVSQRLELGPVAACTLTARRWDGRRQSVSWVGQPVCTWRSFAIHHLSLES
jgi:hypothetical protein